MMMLMKRTLPDRICYRMVTLLFMFSAQIGFSQIPYANLTTPFTMTMEFPGRMLPGDFDNDGDIDVLYQNGNDAGAGFGYAKNTGAGAYTIYTNANVSGTPFATFNFTGGQLSPTGTFAADYDGDGDIDIITRDGAVEIWRNDAGTFVRATNTLNMPMSIPQRMLLGDFDNDGDIDVIYQNGNTAGAGIGYGKNDGAGNFTFYADATVSGTPFTSFNFSGQQITPASMYVFDYDNDGDVDIIDRDLLASTGIWKNNSGSFSHTTNTLDMTMSFPSRIVYGDLDSDGDIDVLYQESNAIGSGFGYMKNNGNGTFVKYLPGNLAGTPFSTFDFTGLQLATTGFFVFDIDGDGDLEIIDRANISAKGLWAKGSIAPKLVSSTPVKGAVNFSPSGNIVLTFNKAVLSGGGNLYIRRNSNGSIVATIPTNGSMVSGTNTAVITVNPATDLVGLMGYYLTFDKNAFVDTAGQIFGVLPTGDRTTNAITSSDFLSFTTDAVLPVNLVYFKASAQEGKAHMQWRTASAVNTSHFQVENSTDGKAFKSVGNLTRKGTDFSREDYQFVHESSGRGAQFYRLKMVDWDGSFTYSNIEVVRFKEVGDLLVYPNPVREKVNVKWNEEHYRTADLYDLSGRNVLSNDLRLGQRQLTQDVSQLAPGIYLLKLKGSKGNSTVKFVKE